jgi:hypothetical protein
MSEVDEKMSIASRKIDDLELAYNDLLQPLPEEVKFAEIRSHICSIHLRK